MITVQWLRALAVVMVVILHVLNKAQNIGAIDKQPFMFGAAGVDLFFIISGFIMVFITYEREISAIDFIVKRLIRIIPLYWMTTTVAAIVFITHPDLINSKNGQTTILNSYTLFPTKDTLLLTVAWTLRYEFIFYFIFAIALLFGSKRYIVCGTVIGLMSSLSLMHPTGFYTSFFTNQIIFEFVLGMASFFILNKINKAWMLLRVLLIPAGIITLFTTNILGYDLNYRVLCYSTSMMFIFLGITSFENSIKKINNIFSASFKNLGDASYSIYLTHLFCIGIVSYFFNHYKFINYSFTFITTSIILSIIAGFFCHKIIEKPLSSFLKGAYKTLEIKYATKYKKTDIHSY